MLSDRIHDARRLVADVALLNIYSATLRYSMRSNLLGTTYTVKQPI